MCMVVNYGRSRHRTHAFRVENWGKLSMPPSACHFRVAAAGGLSMHCCLHAGINDPVISRYSIPVFESLRVVEKRVVEGSMEGRRRVHRQPSANIIIIR